MLNRRILRIKVLQIVYAAFKKPEQSIEKSEKELLLSIQKSQDLFLLILLLAKEMTQYAREKNNLRQKSFLSAHKEGNKNMRFADNRAVAMIVNSEAFKKILNNRRVMWNDDSLPRKIYQTLETCTVFDIYLNEKRDSFRNDKRILKYFFSELLYNSEDFYHALEDMSIFWNYEVDYLLLKATAFIDGLRQETEIRESNIFPKFQNTDDEIFAKQLLVNTLSNSSTYLQMIEKKLTNWDIERISDIDKIILQMAIAEIIRFESIPVKVTFNEYIEIAKQFGTEKSGGFINGILDNLIKHMEKENKFKKTGRGLLVR